MAWFYLSYTLAWQPGYARARLEAKARALELAKQQQDTLTMRERCRPPTPTIFFFVCLFFKKTVSPNRLFVQSLRKLRTPPVFNQIYEYILDEHPGDNEARLLWARRLIGASTNTFGSLVLANAAPTLTD